ncbi:hypothetical protein HanIR_Chr09g0440251 [Helianthus annuus]|nr:hypothetical protein HanIR_Chr09g0440251 [Helianthus annuus]
MNNKFQKINKLDDLQTYHSTLSVSSFMKILGYLSGLPRAGLTDNDKNLKNINQI